MKAIEQNLLHFTSADTAINYIFKNKTLRFNSFKRVNDPRESKDWPFKVFCFYEQNYNKFHEGIFKELHNYIMNHVFISCFSVQNAGKSLSDINHDLRMWAQYGDNHQGVCILFNKNQLEKEIQRATKGNNLFHENIKYLPHINQNDVIHPDTLKGKVIGIDFNGFIYRSLLPLIHPFGKPECNDPYMINLERLLNLGIHKYMEQHILYYRQPLFFTKKECWRDEREYRYIIHSKEENEFLDIPISNSIDAVILGNDFPPHLFSELVNMAKLLNFKIYKLHNRGWDNHFMEIDINNLEEQNIISLSSSYPINFYYEELFYQVCDIQGKNRTLHINSKSGNVTLLNNI
ncbi:DUF2971 domain-containing protein [Priestia megaterium]|uniref:DUF2971 domain-containing protein n=1 Tax=Priestia megaterium TaxID=1404 RepID=UPI002D7EFB46|nr:DUF2971 domain-containing protein [Priestia megaterium]MEB4872108.1 DUF2971 domain-containing protein [Priestia megaterium]